MAVSDFQKAREEIALREAKEKRSERHFLMSEVQNFGRMHAGFLIMTFVLVSYGLIMLFSASISSGYAEAGDPLFYVRKQFGFTILGLAALFIIAGITPIRFYNNFTFMAGTYLVTTALLLLVMIMGTEGDFGAVRWLRLGPIKFQPSEVCKITSIYCMASYFSFVRKMQRQGVWVSEDPKRQLIIDGRVYILIPAIAMGVWLMLVLMQPHLSGAIIIFIITGSLFLVADIPWKVWVSGLIQLLPILLVFALIFILIFPVLKHGQSFFEFAADKFSHVTQRISTFQNPDEASSDQIHQVKQSRYALGSGGLTGKGLGMGQQKSGFLPMVYNDYILPAIGEELGFFGSVSVLALFVIYFLMGTSIALNASGLFSAMMAWGCTFLITMQAMLNMAVAAEVIPATGISLPFFSYGGTANIFFLIAAGFILCVSRSGQRMDKELKELLKSDAVPAAGRSGKGASARKPASKSLVHSGKTQRRVKTRPGQPKRRTGPGNRGRS